jgi:rare lipoprotein A
MPAYFCVLSLIFSIAFVIPSAHASTGCNEEIARGAASWYGPGFENARTQSGERFNPAELSAAHPTLPFGTLVKVVHMRTRQSVMVRINDRGAFKRSVIDLSESAAREIGMIDDGIAPVALFKCN